ncbi:MAG: polymer-forming cytoskeletal protein [Oscillospiraceae bacterium]|nr:polymer-forming cytoskeletal protein [Oscillospiraceae bacterium]
MDTVGSAAESLGSVPVSGQVVQPDDEKTISAPPPQPDAVVMEAFNQASAIGSDDADMDDDFDGDDSAVHSTSGAQPYEAPQFRNFEPPESYENYPDITSSPAAEDGRKIYDFDPDDLYSDDKTIISRNTIIRGELHTDDSVRLLGQIMGDIECKSNIVVAGKVRGNTSAANAYIIDAQIDGNMLCDDAINVNKDAWVLGNIRAQQAEIDGKVKGNIEIRHGVSIGSASSVIGNISTDELEVKRGAFVNGQIIMYSPSRDVIDRFEDFDR